MPLLKPEDEQTLRDRFARELVQPVRIVLYTRTLNCPTCPDAERIADEIAALSDKIELVKKNPTLERASEHDGTPEWLPAWVLETDGEKASIHYYGLPAGYEFSTLVETLVMLSRRTVVLDPDLVETLRQLQQGHDLKVFVTPTCPYCPQMAFLAYQCAQAQPRIRAKVYEASEFPDLSLRYQVRAVPRTVIDDREVIDGAIPPEHLVQRLQELESQTPEADNGADVQSGSGNGGGLIILP